MASNIIKLIHRQYPDKVIKELANIVELNNLNPTYIEIFTENQISTDSTLFSIRSILKDKGDLVYIQHSIPNYEIYKND